MVVIGVVDFGKGGAGAEKALPDNVNTRKPDLGATPATGRARAGSIAVPAHRSSPCRDDGHPGGRRAGARAPPRHVGGLPTARFYFIHH
ncbi:hypothetical protein APASM_3392 [Actinosynnema pretiosum subsp. pretiosum]|nr:hypothetical protein APASM_3392 [Actinosynnema pretiosum subsp. pretiosum]